MKFIHLSDLHLGKRVNEFSMIEDQKYILLQTINIIDDEKPDAVIIAGDIYDKSIPSEEAMLLFDDFLLRLSKRNISVFVISGNHDSSVRLSDHSKLIVNQGFIFRLFMMERLSLFQWKMNMERLTYICFRLLSLLLLSSTLVMRRF